MDRLQVMTLMQESLVLAMKLSAPILFISMGIGIVISIFQAATQIHEQTITFVPKLIAIALVLLIAGPWMITEMTDFANRIFTLMIEMG